MKKAITGYIYRPIDKLGLFQNCSVGQVISKTDDKPPWIIVDNSAYDVVVAKWPGRLWRAEVMNRMLPKQVDNLYDEGVFDAPEIPFYFKPKYGIGA